MKTHLKLMVVMAVATMFQLSLRALTPQRAIECALFNTQVPADRRDAKRIVHRLTTAIVRYKGFKTRMNPAELAENNYRDEHGDLWTVNDLEYIIGQISQRRNDLITAWNL